MALVVHTHDRAGQHPPVLAADGGVRRRGQHPLAQRVDPTDQLAAVRPPAVTLSRTAEVLKVPNGIWTAPSSSCPMVHVGQELRCFSPYVADDASRGVRGGP